MKIQSNFTDYYDKSLMYGIDDNIYFKRITSQISIYDSCFFYTLRNSSLKVTSYSSINITPFVIGFCGTIYRGLTLSYIDDTYKHHKHTFYDSFSCIKYLNKAVSDIKSKTIYTNEGLKEKLHEILVDIDYYFKGFERRFRLSNEPSSYEELHKFASELFIKYNIPYFSITPKEEKHWDKKDNYDLILLPILKDYEFIKMKDPLQAFQEISMYVGGVLQQPVNPMVEISNKDQAIKKGFGHKYAFRKEPTKRRIK